MTNEELDRLEKLTKATADFPDFFAAPYEVLEVWCRKRDSICAAAPALIAAARENARLRAVVEAARYLVPLNCNARRTRLNTPRVARPTGLKRSSPLERELDAALSALDAKGGG